MMAGYEFNQAVEHGDTSLANVRFHTNGDPYVLHNSPQSPPPSSNKLLVLTTRSGQIAGYSQVGNTMRVCESGIGLCSLTGTKLPTIKGYNYGLYTPATGQYVGAKTSSHGMSAGAIAGTTVGVTVGGTALAAVGAGIGYGFAAGASSIPEAAGIAINVAGAALGFW